MKRMKEKEERIEITGETEIAKAISKARILAEESGFGQTEQYMVSTAVSELARNIFRYATKGEVIIRVIKRKAKIGIEIVAEDSGSGIKDIAKAMKDNFSTSEGLGSGLPGVKRLMDEFVIESELKRGTKITVRKWI